MCVWVSLTQSPPTSFPLPFRLVLRSNQANTLILWLFDIYIKISEPGLEYLTVYPVGQLSTQSTSLCNQTATRLFQPAGLYSQPTDQPSCLCASLLPCPSVRLPICICLFQYISRSASQSIRLSAWHTPLILRLRFRPDSTLIRHTTVLENSISTFITTIKHDHSSTQYTGKITLGKKNSISIETQQIYSK